MGKLLAAFVILGLVLGLGIGGANAAGAEVKVDGCTLVPDSGRTFDFNEACITHDQCYLERPYGDSAAARKQCDVEFYWDMVDSCRDDWPKRSQWVKRSACYGVAGVYYLGVRALGGFGWTDGTTAPIAEGA